MPVTFKKKVDSKKTTESKMEKEASAFIALSEMVDSLYERIAKAKDLRSQLAAMEKDIAPAKAEFLERYTTAYSDLDDAKVITGKKHQLKVSKAGEKRTVEDIEPVFHLLESVQEGLFQELAKVNLRDLDSYLTPEQLAGVITKVRDKMNRTITVVAG